MKPGEKATEQLRILIDDPDSLWSVCPGWHHIYVAVGLPIDQHVAGRIKFPIRTKIAEKIITTGSPT